MIKLPNGKKRYCIPEEMELKDYLNFILGQQPMASIGIIIAETRGFQIWLAGSCCVKWGEFQYQLVHPLHIKVG